jgi:hypothetical protein
MSPQLAVAGGWMNKTNAKLVVVLGVSLLCGTRAHAQDSVRLQTGAPSDQVVSDEDIKLFRKDLRSVKKQIIAANLELTEAEAEHFWPIYDRYTAELVNITDKKYALLKNYHQNYYSMTDEQAEEYIKGRGEVEAAVTQLRLKYVPIFRKVISGKSTALFFQLDWRLGTILDLQMASEMPLIEQ